MSMIRVHVADLLHTPLPDLNPLGFDAGQMHCMQSLPRFCDHLKLIYGLKALELLAERSESENLEALVFAARILASAGAVVSLVPDAPLTVFIDTATLALNGLPPANEQPPVAQTDLTRRPDYFSQLLWAEWRWLHYGKKFGHSAEVVRCTAGLILALWEFAPAPRRGPRRGLRQSGRHGFPGGRAA
ncbi:MAG: hypothetical protein GY838_05370 [bacterium]|nr:hypothetical protein [bacterium]